MIDLNRETPLSIAEASHRLPPSRGGRPTHPATITKWITDGLQGVKLEAVKVGCRWITSAEALQRFAAALTEARSNEAVGV